MDKRRVLILDIDSDTLIALQHLLEGAEFDTTVTWYQAEACQLAETALFDLLLIADHPPELDGAAILDDLSFRGTCPPVLILKSITGENDAAYFHRLGATGVVLKHDLPAVLNQVTKTFAHMQFKAKSLKAAFAEARSWRAAS